MKVRELFEGVTKQFTSKEQIDKWCNKVGITGYMINADLSITCSSILLMNQKFTELPVKINDVMTLDIDNCSNLSSFKNFPITSRKIILKDCAKLTSFSGIADRVKSCEMIICNTEITSNVLSLLKIEDLTLERQHNRPKWMQIVNNHLPNTKGNQGIMDCQRELIDAGLAEYAKL